MNDSEDFQNIDMRFLSALAGDKQVEQSISAHDAYTDVKSILDRHQLPEPDVMSQLVIKRKHRYRAGLQRQSLTELLPTLPSVHETVYLLSNANAAGSRHRGFSFSTFIGHLSQLMGNRVRLSVSVWTIAKDSAIEIIEMTQAGKIAEAHFCFDQYFIKREFETAQLIASALQNTPFSMTVFRNHSKVIQMASEDGEQVVTVTGSGNLSSQPRIEQYVVDTSPQVYAFFQDNLFSWVRENAKRP